MKLSWHSLKVSIAGARLSHLVQKDKIWDHGSMTEQVKNIFYQLEKAKNKNDLEQVKKYLSAAGFENVRSQIQSTSSFGSFLKNSVLTEISIIKVRPGKALKADRFNALIKGKRKLQEPAYEQKNYGIENFSEEWCFVRQGDWWMLDGIKR